MNRIINAECLGVLRNIPVGSIDLIVTSPPYAEQRKKSYGGVSAEKYVDWFSPISKELIYLLKPTGSFVLNIKESVNCGERQTYVMELVTQIKKHGWLWVDEFIWNKTNPFPTGAKTRLKDGFERIFHFTKTKDYKFFPEAVLSKSTSKYAGSNDKRRNKGAFSTNNGSDMKMGKRITGDMVRPSNVLTFPSSCINIGHPATFPIELPDFFIKLMTEPGDTVLDPFIGSGTTALSAIALGRKFIGIEKSAEYCQLASDRIGRKTMSLIATPPAAVEGETP